MLSTLIFGGAGRAGLTDTAWWQEIAESWGGGKSKAGVTVSKKAAIGLSTVWRCVNLIAGDVAKVPFHAFKRVDDARGRTGKTRANEHPAYRLMRWRANREQTALAFREQMQADALLHGNGYAFIDRLGDGTPHELRWLDPTRTYPERKGGVLGYIHQRADGSKAPPIPPENVFHLRGLGDDGLAGYSVLTVARETLGLGIAARDFGARFFGNNSISPLVFETDHPLTPKQRTDLRSEWERQQSGDNQHRTAVLPRGVHPKTIGHAAADTQMLETMDMSRRDIANIFGCPAHKVGDTTRTSYSSLEQENLSYLQETLDLWLCKWEFESWLKLLTVPQQQRDSHFFEFERKALIRMDSRARASYNRTALGGAPWETINEVRAKENLDPIDDPKADELQWPLNMGENPDAGQQDDPSGEGGAGEPDPAAGDDPKQDDVARTLPSARTAQASAQAETVTWTSGCDVSARTPVDLSRAAIRGILVRDCGRVASRITIVADKVARKKPKGYCDWLESFEADHRQAVAGMILEPVLLAVLASGKAIIRPQDILLAQARELLDKAADATVEGLPDAVAIACNDFAAWARRWAEEQVA